MASPGSRFRGGAPLAPDGPGTPGNSYGSGWYSTASPSYDYYARDGIRNDYYGLDGFTRGNSYRSSPNGYYAWDGSVQGGEMARQQARRRDEARRRMWQGGYGEMGRYGSSPRDYYEFDGTTVQGGSLKTWSFTNPSMERVQVNLETDGRPLNADIDLWHGPDNTPLKVAVYSEDGMARPFNAVIETPGDQHALRINNTAALEYPLKAIAETDNEGFVWDRIRDPSNSQQIQGGASETFTVEPSVESVAVFMQTDGRPLNATIELLQGPDNNRQVIDIYTEDGLSRPFYAIIQTPGSGNVVRVLNTATMEYPLMCIVEPYYFGNSGYGNYGYDQGNYGGYGNYGYDQAETLARPTTPRFAARPYGEPWTGVDGRSKRRLTRDEILSWGRNM